MYNIHYKTKGDRMAMKRTQLFITEEMYRILSALSRQHGKSISELVRQAVTEKYIKGNEVDKVQMVDKLAGLWKHRKDLKDVDKYVRSLRKDSRRKRFGSG